MSELQSLVDSIRLSGSPGSEQIDTLASAMESRLNLQLDHNSYRKLAEQMLQLSIHNNVVPSPSRMTGVAHTASFASPQRRGRSPARADTNSSSGKRRDTSVGSTSSTGGFRGSSPIRHLFGGGNKIPPTAKEPRASSPFSFFRPFNAKKAQEEKKDQEKEARPGMRDQSPGASPHRLNSQRLPSTQQGGSNTAYQPPKQIFQPVSPVRPPVSSRPSTPVQGPERPPSRSSSPFCARPGLQEDDMTDSLAALTRSPGRVFDGSTVPPPNVRSGMSSQLPTKPVPTGVGHRRMYSGGGGGVDLDNDSSSKPFMPNRAHSRSPMRRPSPVDDAGEDRPVPPRAFSASPRSRSTEFVQVKGTSSSSSNIHMPDLSGLSMPVFQSPNGTSGESLFTPPPRAQPPLWSTRGTDASAMSTEPLSTSNHSVNDINDGSHKQSIGGFQPRPFGPDVGDDFQFGSGNKSNARRIPNRSRSGRSDAPIPGTPPLPRDHIFSPMDIDEPSPVPPGMPSQPPLVNNDRFEIGPGTKAATKPRVTRARRPSGNAAFPLELPIPKSAENSSASIDHVTPASKSDAPLTHSGIDYSGRVSYITSKREEAKVYHMSGDYRSSIAAYTDAIKVYGEASAFLTSDTLAVLLSNRAAGLLMIGAYEAAVADCEQALRKVTPPRGNEPFSNDSGLLLKIKLSTRLARAHLKLGDHSAASTAFHDAIRTANTASQFSKTNHTDPVYQQNMMTLSQMITEATLGQADAKRLRDACGELSESTKALLRFPSERVKLAECLGHVNMALSIASGSVPLIENKLSLLVQMKRWREVAGFCERLAAFNVGLDNAFKEDLALKHPFPGVPPAQSLKYDYFGNLRDEDAATRELKLNSRAAAEAVLRIPYSITPIYLRALRLEERYPAADAALRALDELVKRGTGVHGSTKVLQTKFSWLLKERSKLDRTKEGRELGDVLFRDQEFEKAAAKYGDCLLIDAEALQESSDGLNAGGRLHAVLHCNRAACLMALRRFHGAVDECSYALKIHSRYMKAILRRARCYTRLNRTQEAIAEYKRWLDLVEDAKKLDYPPSSPCLFDGPHDVKPAEVTLTQNELEDLYKAKRRADAAAKEEADRRRDREKQRFQDSFSNSWRSTSSSSAHDRRDQWYNDQSGSRRWDSFSNRGPRSSSNPRPDFAGAGTEKDFHRSNSQGRTRHESLVSPRSNPSDHYSILNLPPHATLDEIKKSFRKLALKYHPDKNTEEGASDNFRRVKLAHEVLSDPMKRRQYDSERQLGRP